MAVVVKDEHMAVGGWSAEVDWSPLMLDLLTEMVGGKREPRDLHALVYDSDGLLMAPPLVLLSVGGGEEGLVVGGRGMLWWLGTSDEGPKTGEREFVSGRDKLSNGEFLQGENRWRQAPQDSRWVISTGTALNDGGRLADDPLESDEVFPTRPGHSYRVQARGVTGRGRLRVRVLYQGKFNPPNLLPDAGFGGGGWSTTPSISIVGSAMHVRAIPKPQLVSNADFMAGSAGWSTAPQLSFVGGVVSCAPIPYPQLLINPFFDLGPGYPWAVSEIGDITFVNDPAEASPGSSPWVIKVGPIRQKQLLKNPNFDPEGGAGIAAPPSFGGTPQFAPVGPGAVPYQPPDPAIAELVRSMVDEPPAAGLAQGARGRGVAALQAYLARYGYLAIDVQALASNPDDAEFDQATTEALRRYQRFYKLRATGRLTRATVELMRKPRCGVPDVVPGGPTRARGQAPPGGPETPAWVYIGTKWENVSVLRWHLTNPGPFTQSQAAGAIVYAFSQWEATNIPLSFEESYNQPNTHMVFRWMPLGGPAASAWQPPGSGEPLTDTNAGDVQYDNTLNWSLDGSSPGYDFTSITLHEIGHALGLNHSDVQDSIMYAGIAAYPGRHTLHADDIAGIEWVYNQSSPPPPPPSGAAIPYWFMNSDNNPGPENGLFYRHPTDGLDSGPGATTDGAANPRGVKYLRADYVLGGGVEEHPVTPGEEWEFSAFVRRSPNANGRAYISTALPHPSDIPKGMRWKSTRPFDENLAGETHEETSISVSIPPNRTEINLLLEVHDHSAGYWTFSQASCIRTRGNRDRMDSVVYPVEPRTSYRLSSHIRSGGDQQVGSCKIGGILSGLGKTEVTQEQEQGHTDYEWTLAKVDFTPDDGYTGFTPFIMGLDIVGDPYWVDNMLLEKTSNNVRRTTHAPFPITASQKYTLAADVLSGPQLRRGSATVGVVFSGAGLADRTEVVRSESTKGESAHLSHDVTPEDGYTSAVVFVEFQDTEGDNFHATNVTLTKADNNTETSSGSVFSVTPERTYHWEEEVVSNAHLQRGTVTLSARCIRAGYPDVVFDSAPMEGTKGEHKRLVFDFTPPSGYDQVQPRIIATDVEGPGDALWIVDHGDLRDTDSASVVFDAVVSNPTGTSHFVDSVAPDGAESVRCLLVVEAGGGPWSVDAVSLARTGVTPATGDDILGEVLTDGSGAAIGPVPGAISCPEVIPYDWRVANLTRRAALDHYCTVVSEPPREHRITASDPPLINVGTAEVVNTDHSPESTSPIVVVPADRDVEPLSPMVVNVEERVTEIEVLGAVRRSVSGQDSLIRAVAQVPGRARRGYGNAAVARTRTVTDGTVDHDGYATALAVALAEKEASPSISMTVTLTGAQTRPDCPPGDWIYVYSPKGGLEDPDRPTQVQGETVFPRRVRVFTRTREFGPGHRIVMRRPDGSTFELRGVTWSDQDATTLVVGDRRPEWQADPQGPSPSVQWERDRRFQHP